MTSEEQIADIRKTAKDMQSLLDHSMAELLFSGKMIKAAEIADLSVELILRHHHEVLETLMSEMHAKRKEQIKQLLELADHMEQAQNSPE